MSFSCLREKLGKEKWGELRVSQILDPFGLHICVIARSSERTSHLSTVLIFHRTFKDSYADSIHSDMYDSRDMYYSDDIRGTKGIRNTQSVLSRYTYAYAYA